MKKYIYKENEYRTERALRVAIFEAERLALPKVETDDDWAKYGVELVTVETPYVEPKEPDLDELKQMKLGALDGAFNEYRNSSETFLVSSLGFKANANTIAFDNVSGLVAQLQYRQDNGEANPLIGFMTFDDELVTLSLADLKKLQVEISENGSLVYAKKWEIRKAIEQAKNEEALSKIDIMFG